MDISGFTKPSIPAVKKSNHSNKPVNNRDSSVPDKLPRHIPGKRKERRKQQRRSIAQSVLLELRGGRGRRASDHDQTAHIDITI